MTYTTETLIQAGHKNMAVRSVRVGTNPAVRPSRLFRKTSRYVLVQGANILRMSALYKPLPVFLGLSAILFVLGAGLFGRYVWFLATRETPGAHLQSLLLATVFLVGSFLSFLTGLLADLISINRTLLEEILLRQRRHEAARGAEDRDDARG